MSFNRLEYDTCAYAKELQESTTPLEYQLYLGKFENDESCVCNPNKNLKCMVELGTRADVENELFNLKRPNHTSRCPEKKFSPNKKENFTHSYHPPYVCETIYHLTPTNVVKPTSNGLKPLNNLTPKTK
jgi:hypothetical protein